MATTMAALTETDEVAEAREQTAARLERMARLIRANTTADVAQLDAVYAEIVKLASRIRPILLNK